MPYIVYGSPKVDGKAKQMQKLNSFMKEQKEVAVVSYKESLNNGTATVELMQSMEAIPLSEIKDFNNSLAIAAYKAVESKVAETTILAQIGTVDPKIFFKDGKFDKELFCKIYKIEPGKSIPGKKYRSVFYNRYNKFVKVDFALGIKYTIYMVNAAVIHLFKKRLSEIDLDAVTCVEDIAQIMLDLDPINRALQESSIDVTKDSGKDFKIYASDLVNSDLKALNAEIKKNGTKNNIDDCLLNPKKVEYEAVLNLDEEFMKDVCVETDAAKSQLAILESSNKFINDLIECYSTTTNDGYLDYKEYAYTHKELTSFIRDVMMTALNTFEDQASIDKHKVSLLRNAIYREAEDLGVDKMDVIKCGIAASFVSFKDADGELVPKPNLNKFKFWQLTKLFGDIFIREYSGKEYLEVKTCVDEVYEDLNHGTEIKIEDGIGYVFDENQNPIEVLSVIDEDLNCDAVVSDGELLLKYVPENEVDTSYKLLFLDSLVETKNGKIVDVKVEQLSDAQNHIDKLLNLKCGEVNGYLFVKNPVNNKGIRVGRFKEDCEVRGVLNIVDVVIGKGGVAILIKTK